MTQNVRTWPKANTAAAKDANSAQLRLWLSSRPRKKIADKNICPRREACAHYLNPRSGQRAGRDVLERRPPVWSGRVPVVGRTIHGKDSHRSGRALIDVVLKKAHTRMYEGRRADGGAPAKLGSS